jgi:hypothetical protein
MDKEPKNTGKMQGRDEKGKFLEGVSGNPKGKPKGSKNYLTLLEEALEQEAKKAGITYWQRLAQWCFTNPQMAGSVLKKFLPDKTAAEIDQRLSGELTVKFKDNDK